MKTNKTMLSSLLQYYTKASKVQAEKSACSDSGRGDFGTNGKLKKFVEQEARRDKITRGDLVEAAEVSYLYNRSEMLNWLRDIKKWRRKKDFEDIAGVGILRQELERRYDISPQVSLAVIQATPDYLMFDMLSILWDDGTGRNRLEDVCDTIMMHYNCGGGGD